MVDQKLDLKENMSLMLFSPTVRCDEGRNPPVSSPGFVWGPLLENSYTSKRKFWAGLLQRKSKGYILGEEQPVEPCTPISDKKRTAAGC